MNLLIIFVIAAIPALFWLGFFYFKDPEPEPRRWLLDCFLSGALAVLPVLGFSYMWQVFTGMDWLSWVNSFSVSTLVASLFSVIWLAILEEFFKHTAVVSACSEMEVQFNELSDGMIYSVTAAIGFSMLENVAYLWTLFGITGLNNDFWLVFFFRGVGTMLGHIVFSGVFGFFWGLAVYFINTKHEYFYHHQNKNLKRFYEEFFRSDDPEKSSWKKLRETLTLHTVRCVLAEKEEHKGRLSPYSLVAEGFWLAILLHVVFNLLVSFKWEGQSLTFLIVPFLSFSLLFLLHQLSRFGKIQLREKMVLPSEEEMLVE
jgi:protease PrsW